MRASSTFGQLAVDADGRMFVTQIIGSGAGGVRVFGADGAMLGSWGDPGLGDGQLGFPWGIALDGSGGAYVTEFGGDPQIPSKNRLQKFQLTLP